MDVHLAEASDRPGGMVRSERHDDFLLEFGPNSYRRTGQTESLTGGLGLDASCQRRRVRDCARYIWDGRRLVTLRLGPLGLAATRLLSPRAKLGLLAEPFRRGCPPDDESVADFTRRHFGSEVLKKVVEPFVSGIYAGDAERLSFPAAFPTLWEFARPGGSVVRGVLARMFCGKRMGSAVNGPVQAAAHGFRKDTDREKVSNPEEIARRGSPNKKRLPSALCSYRGGLSDLTARLAEDLGDRFHPRVRVLRVESCLDVQGVAGYRVVASGQGGESLEWRSSGLVVATPAGAAADILGPIVPEAAAALSSIPYSPLAVVHAGLPEESLAVRPHGFGFLVVRGSDVRALGVLFSSAMYDGRAPRGHSLLTLFYGGATDPAILGEDDDFLARQVEHDLARTAGWDGRKRLLRITRLPAALPAYELGHREKLDRIDSALSRLPAPVKLLGNYLRGISIPDCIRQAAEAADDLAERVGLNPGCTGQVSPELFMSRQGMTTPTV